MKKILVPCDFSDCSIEAFKFAVDLVAQSQGEVFVLKVIDLPVVYESTFGMPPYVLNQGFMKELDDDAKTNFIKMIEKYGKKFPFAEFTVIHGPTTPIIREFIEDKKIDLVVMGTHGATGMKEFFVGSNTEKIVRFSKVPVFSIKKAVPMTSIKNIVFPTLLELDQSDLVGKIKVLQNFFKAKLHILVVNTPSNFRTHEEQKLAMEEYVRHYGFENYTSNIRNDTYFESDSILRFTTEVQADMIAMGTHARKGIAHFLNGSTAEDVVNHVNCPIWTSPIRR